MMHRNWFSVRNIVGNVARCFASDAAVESKVGSSKLVELKKPAGWAMPEKTAFIDGICMERNAGFGVFWGENHADNTYGAVEGAQTGNRAKFAAAIEAVKQAHKNGDKEVALRTESLFIYNCMTRWVSEWKMNGWKKKDGQEVKLKDLIQELDDLSAKLEVRYELIDEEKGDFGHDNANRLAIAGAKLALQERGLDPATASKPTARASKPKETSPRAKFVAAIEIVKQALDNGQKEVSVRTDSVYLYKSMTKWVSGWKTNGWKKKDGQEVKLKDLIQELDDLSAKLEVRYELIDEEKGDFGYDNANRLAIAGAKLALQERGVDPATASKPTARASKPKETGPRAKFVAAIETVKQALDNGQKEVTVRTDSDYLYKSMTKWVSGWKKYGWKNIEGEEVKHKDLIQELDDLSAKLEVSYELVQKPKKSKAITLD